MRGSKEQSRWAKRDRKRRKARYGHKVSGGSVRKIQAIIVRKGEEARTK